MAVVSDLTLDAPCDVTILTAGGPTVVIGVRGDVDIATVGVVEDAVRVALRSRPAHLVLDLVGVTFCGVRGMALVITTAAAAAELGVAFSVCGASAQAVRLWPLLWNTSTQPACFRDVAAAVGQGCSAGEAAVEHRVAERAVGVGRAEQGLGGGQLIPQLA